MIPEFLVLGFISFLLVIENQYIIHLPSCIIFFLLKILWLKMGCGESNLRQLNFSQRENQASRKDKKRQKLQINSLDEDGYENVKKNISIPITQDDFNMAEETFKKHYLFYKLKDGQRDELITSMEIYTAEKDQIIFKKGDPAHLFFIIKSGIVSVKVNDKEKFLTKGQYFGELGLLYKAPRSATIVAKDHCQFLCLSHQLFRKISQEIIKKSYQLAKSHIETTSIFRYLTKKEKNIIAFNTYNLRFQKDSIIFKEGDDATSFFIVVRGKVQIQIPGKKSFFMGFGDSFGENCFQSKSVRSGTARATEMVELLAIGGTCLKKYLGEQLRDLSFYNIIKWSLQRSQVFNWMSDYELEKVISVIQVKKYQDKSCICAQGDIPKFVAICLQQKINSEDVGSIFNCEYLLCHEEDCNNMRISVELMKNGKGHVAQIPFASINKILGKSIDLLLKRPISQEQIKNYDDLRNQYIRGLKLKDFKVVSKLGEGQFGNVVCVEDKYNKCYALKCIEKNKTIENNMEDYILNQKRILEQIDFPFINKLYATYDDDHFVYFLLKLIDGGDFFHILRHIGICSKSKAQFYIGCMILSLECLHSKNIIYRDLKPENSVVDKKGYLHLIDLGTAKFLYEQSGYRTFTIIGTPHYMAPQVSQNQGYTFSADIWSLGIVLYEMVCGVLPYGDQLDDPFEVLKAISSAGQLTFPKNYEDQTGIHLISLLLNRDPIERHYQNFTKIKNSSFFDDFSWQALEKKSLNPPFKINREKVINPIQLPFPQFIKGQKHQLKERLKSQHCEWNDHFKSNS